MSFCESPRELKCSEALAILASKHVWRTVADWIFHLFQRFRSKSRICNKIRNFLIDYIALGPECVQEVVFKRSGFADLQQVGSSDHDRTELSFKLELIIFGRLEQLWMKSTTINQRYRTNLLFVVSACLFYCITRCANWFTIDLHIGLELKQRLHTYTCIKTNNYVRGLLF